MTALDSLEYKFSPMERQRYLFKKVPANGTHSPFHFGADLKSLLLKTSLRPLDRRVYYVYHVEKNHGPGPNTNGNNPFTLKAVAMKISGQLLFGDNEDLSLMDLKDGLCVHTSLPNEMDRPLIHSYFELFIAKNIKVEDYVWLSYDPYGKCLSSGQFFLSGHFDSQWHDFMA